MMAETQKDKSVARALKSLQRITQIRDEVLKLRPKVEELKKLESALEDEIRPLSAFEKLEITGVNADAEILRIPDANVGGKFGLFRMKNDSSQPSILIWLGNPADNSDFFLRLCGNDFVAKIRCTTSRYAEHATEKSPYDGLLVKMLGEACRMNNVDKLAIRTYSSYWDIKIENVKVIDLPDFPQSRRTYNEDGVPVIDCRNTNLPVFPHERRTYDEYDNYLYELRLADRISLCTNVYKGHIERY